MTDFLHAEMMTAYEEAVDRIDALEKQRDELVAALEGVLAGFDAQIFVRSTVGDLDPMWGIKLLPYLKALADARELLAKAKGAPDD